MTVDVEAISRVRLASWRRLLVRHHATPVVLVAVGHDHESGVVRILSVDDGPSDDELAVLLVEAATRLIERRAEHA